MEEIIKDLEKKYMEVGQDIENNDVAQNWTNKEVETFIKGYQFAMETAIDIIKENNGVMQYELKDRLYQEIKDRYSNLDNLAKRIQDNVFETGEIEVEEQDKTDLCAVLDIFDGQIL